MASIEERLKNVRTLEDIVNLLTILFTNMNNQNNLYYDMFINPEPLTLTLERYDDNGELIKVELPNRAKDIISMKTGSGNPENNELGDVGIFYLDLENKDLYFKSSGYNNKTGWRKVRDFDNTSFEEYLKKNGDGSQLTNLSASALSGQVNVENGGTGTNRLEGVLKGNGTNAVTSAIPNTDYLAPNDFIGMIMWSPLETLTGNWLVCDGSSYSTTGTYYNLYTKIGTKYNKADDPAGTFRVPNLIDKYVKGGQIVDVGTEGSASVGPHTHKLSGNTGNGTEHYHGGGSLTVPNTYLLFSLIRRQKMNTSFGAFDLTAYTAYRGDADGDGNYASWQATWNPAGKWSGTTGDGTEHTHPLTDIETNSGEHIGTTTDVDHMVLVPVIRY